MKDHICEVWGEYKKSNTEVVKWENLFNVIPHIHIEVLNMSREVDQ